MLNQIKRTLTKLAAPGNRRTEALRVRCLLERLEDRTMLSASYGSLAHGYGGPDFGPHGGSSQPRFGDSAAFASQQHQQRPVSYDSQTFSGLRESGPAYREYQGHPTMQSAFPPPQRISEGGQQWSPEPGWNQFVAAPSHENAYSYNSGPEYSSYMSYVAPKPTYTATFYYIEYVPTNVQDKQPLNFADPNDFVPTNALGVKPPLDGTTGLASGGIDLRQVNRQTTRNNQFQSLPDVVGKLTGTILPLNSVLTNIVSTTSELPITSQILSRDTTTVAALNAVARDVAFQEFSTNLFQANATTAYDRMKVDAIRPDTTQSEVVTGLIPPADESTMDDIAKSSDAVVREREAVDAVLEHLHDVDSLLPATESQDVNSKIDLQAETALDELPAGEVDGGMVLLQSTGDANGSGFDLTPVYAEHVERFNTPAKMETSVGMFQAVDVATDDAPVIEAVPQTESTTQLNGETKLDDKLPTERERSSHKAAALLGATTLTGALVWLNRSGSKSFQPEPTAQKRRASRG